MTKKLLQGKKHGPIWLWDGTLARRHWMLWKGFPGLDELMARAQELPHFQEAFSDVQQVLLGLRTEAMTDSAGRTEVLPLPKPTATRAEPWPSFTELVPGVVDIDNEYLRAVRKLRLRVFVGPTHKEPMRLVNAKGQVVGLLMGAVP